MADGSFIGCCHRGGGNAIHALLPIDLLERLTTLSSPLLPQQWAVLSETGCIHHCVGPWDSKELHQVGQWLQNHSVEKEKVAWGASGHAATLFPISDDYRRIGYLAIPFSKHRHKQNQKIGYALVNLFTQFMCILAASQDNASKLASSLPPYRLAPAETDVAIYQETQDMFHDHTLLIHQEKMKAMGQLSSGLAHEMNNPLGFILSNLSTLKGYARSLTNLMQRYRRLYELCCAHNNKKLGENITFQCRTIQEAETTLDGRHLLGDIPDLVDETIAGAQRIHGIVMDLSAAGKSGASGRMPINVHQSLDTALSTLQHRIGPGIATHRNYKETPEIYGFSQDIHQVWLNLIGNALDALDGCGSVIIGTRREGNDVQVTIEDTGEGISTQDLSKIFDPFFTTKTVGTGRGLGLHLAYHLIAKHNGRIHAHSEAGKGSIFRVCLPAVKWA